MNLDNLFLLVYIIMMYAGYCMVRKFVNEFTKSIAKPCDEATQAIKEFRQSTKEVKMFFEDKQKREELVQIAAASAAIGIGALIIECLAKMIESKPKSPRVPHSRVSR